MKDVRIVTRVTVEEKEQITALSKRCGLPQTEYIRQRALGYAPGATLTDSFFALCEKLDVLTEKPYSQEVNTAALTLLADMERLIAPGKENAWQPPDSGQ